MQPDDKEIDENRDDGEIDIKDIDEDNQLDKGERDDGERDDGEKVDDNIEINESISDPNIQINNDGKGIKKVLLHIPNGEDENEIHIKEEGQQNFFDPMALAETQLELDKLREEMYIRIQDLQDDLENANETIKQLKEVDINQKDKIEELTSKNASYESQLELEKLGNSESINSLKEQNSFLQNQIGEIHENISKNQKEQNDSHETYHSEIEKLTKTINDSQDKLNFLDKTVSEKSNQNIILEEDVKSKDKNISNLQKKIKKLNDEMDKEKKKLISTERAMQVEKQVATSNLMIAEQKIQILEQRLRFHSMNTSGMNTSKTSENTNITLPELNKPMDFYSNTNLDSQELGKTNLIDTLQNTITNLESDIQNLKVDLQSKDQKLKEEKESIKTTKKEKEVLQRKIDQIKVQFEIDKVTLDNKIQELVTNKMKEERGRIEFGKELEKKSSILTELEKNKIALLDKINKLNSDLEKKSEEIKKLQSQKTEGTPEKNSRRIDVTPTKKTGGTSRVPRVNLGKKKDSRTNISSVVTPLYSRKSQRMSQLVNFNDFIKNINNINTPQKNLSPIEEFTFTQILKEGWLVIQLTDENGKRQWKRYYFTVCGDDMNYYPNNKQMESEEIGKFNINNCEVKRADTMTTKPNSFIISCGQKDYSFYADDEEKCVSWIEFLQHFKVNKR